MRISCCCIRNIVHWYTVTTLKKTTKYNIVSFIPLKAMKGDTFPCYYTYSMTQTRLFFLLPTHPCMPLLPLKPPTHPLHWHTSEQDPAPFVLGSLLCYQLVDRAAAAAAACSMSPVTGQWQKTASHQPSFFLFFFISIKWAQINEYSHVYF